MMDLKKIESAINQLAAERKLPKDELVEIIEAAIRTAYKKDFGNKDEIVNVVLDFEENTISLALEKTIVDEVENEYTEILRSELGDDADSFDIGDVIEIDVSDIFETTGGEFGRIASQAARQVIIQKLGESEKNKVYELFKDKQGQVVNVKVDMVENDRVFLDFNGTQVLLPRGEQCSRDRYVPGMRFYVYVKQVEDAEKGEPRVILSRKDINLVIKLFEQNTPELEEGTVEIVKIVREAGFKTKLIVASEFEEIDPAGSLIGPKGTRVKTVVEELSGEKVDVINYVDDPRELIAAALNPAKILDVKIEEDDHAFAYLEKDEEVRAIGRAGANVRLAEQLTGYKISLKGVGDEEEEDNSEEPAAEEPAE